MAPGHNVAPRMVMRMRLSRIGLSLELSRIMPSVYSKPVLMTLQGNYHGPERAGKGPAWRQSRVVTVCVGILGFVESEPVRAEESDTYVHNPAVVEDVSVFRDFFKSGLYAESGPVGAV